MILHRVYVSWFVISPRHLAFIEFPGGPPESSIPAYGHAFGSPTF